MNARIPVLLLLLGLLILPLAAGCAYNSAEPGGPADPSDWFWIGLIAVITFVVGFLVGATASRNGGIRVSRHSHRHRRRTDAGWNRIAQRVKDGTSQGLTEWRSAGSAEQSDWGELSRRIEERILEELRKHHD